MKYIKFQIIALTAALIGATIAGFNTTVMAEQALESTKTLAGRIDSSSSLVPVPGGSAMQGVQYSFEAQAGDDIEIKASRDEGSTIDVILVVYPPNGSPTLIDATNTEERFQEASIGVGGTWKVTVVSAGSLAGNYHISLVLRRNGAVVRPEPQLSNADQVMKKLGLNSTACSSPAVVAVIDIGGEKRCTRGWDPGEWVYNADKNELTLKQPADPYIAKINSWGATRVDCNAGTAVVRIAFEANKAYCIQPTSEVPAGNYTYDRTTGEIFPLNAVSPTPSYTPPAVNTPPDEGPLL
jgi:hypothetical protein